MKETFERLVDHLLEGGFFLEEAVEILEKTLIARAVERTDGLELRRVDQIFGYPNQTLVGIDFHLGRTDLAAVAQQAEMKLDEDGFPGQVLDIHDRQCCRHLNLPS